MATIDNLELQINVNNEGAIGNIKKLADALSSLKGITGDRIEKIATGFSSLKDSIKGIRVDSISKIERLADALERVASVNISSDTVRAFRTLNSATRRMTQKSAETRERFFPPALVNEQRGGGLRATSAEGEREFYGSFREIRQEEDDLVHHTQDTIGLRMVRTIRNAFRNVSREAFSVIHPFERVRRVISRITTPFRNFIRSIGRIALYRAIRGMIKAITQGITEGVQNLAQFSKLMNEMDTHNANRVLSLYASNFLYLKNAIATAVIPILKTLEPLIASVINRIIDFTNVLAQMFSAFSGVTTFTKAKYYFVDYAQSLDKASGSAGKLNKQLAQFDELNNLTTSSGSGSGSGMDYLDMFEDPVPIADWILELKDKLAEGDWYGIGETLSLKLRDALNGIDWDKIGDSSSRKGGALAMFINGLIRPDTAYAIGKTIMMVFMTGLKFFNAFASTMEWKNIGASFAGFLNGLVENIQPEEIASAINNAVHAIFEIVYGFATEFKWGEFLSKMFNTLADIDISTYAVLLGAFIARVCAGTTVSEADVSSIGSSIISALGGYLIGNGLGQIIASILGDNDLLSDYQELNPFSADTELGEATYGFWETVFDFWSDPWQGITGTSLKKTKAQEVQENLEKYMSESMTRLDEQMNDYVFNFSGNIDDMIGIITRFGEAFDYVDDEYIETFFSGTQWGGYLDLVKDTMSYREFLEIGKNAGEGMRKAIAEAIMKILEAWQNLVNDFKNNPLDISMSIKTFVETVSTEISNIKTVANTTPATYVGNYAGDSSSQGKVNVGIDPSSLRVSSIPNSLKLPTKPTGMPESSWQSYLENWKKQNPAKSYYANGGFVNQPVGSLFVAGEQGAELVGNFNGRTGVANTDQITEAMYTATYDAMSKALAENGMNVVIEGDADKMFRVMQNKSQDFRTRTGRYAF